MSDAPLALTIGHSNRALDEFIDLLSVHGVEVLVDVRKMPRSKRNPQFNLDTLPEHLAIKGIQYLHLPELGGLRKGSADSVNRAWRNESFRAFADYMQTPAFAEAADRLAEIAARDTICLMCAEAVPWRCHRNLISDALLARGLRVEHILGEGARRVHELPPFARVDGCSVSYPGEPELPFDEERPGP